MTERQGQGRRTHSPQTWGQAREAYLAGRSAAEVCGLFGLDLSALRKRARREGWRRSDQADAHPGDRAPDPDLQEDLDEELEALGPADLPAMAERALRLAARALALGDLAPAAGWTRTARSLRALAAEQTDVAAGAEAARVRRAEETRRQAALTLAAEARALGELGRVARASGAAGGGDVHPVHPVHPQILDALVDKAAGPSLPRESRPALPGPRPSPRRTRPPTHLRPTGPSAAAAPGWTEAADLHRFPRDRRAHLRQAEPHPRGARCR